MPRAYTVSVENVTITNAGGDADLVELDASTDKPICLTGIGVNVLSELQEAQEEWLRCQVTRGNTTTGNGTSQTPRPASPADAAASFTAKTFGTTPASAGTAVVLHPFGVPVRAGWEFIYPGGMEWWTSGAELLCVRLMAAPADDVSADLVFFVTEYP